MDYSFKRIKLMPKNIMELKLPANAKLLFSLLVICILVWWMVLLKEILVLFSFSILLAVLLFPLCRKLEKWHFPRTLAILVCLLFCVIVLIGLIFLASLQIADLSDSIPVFQKKAETLIDHLQIWASKNFHISRKKQIFELRNHSINVLKNSASWLTGSLASLINSLSSMALVPIFAFFMLLYRDFFKHFLYQLFHKTKVHKIDFVSNKIYEVVQSYLAGLLLVIAIVACLNTVGLLLLGIDYAVFFGVFAAFLLLIPYIGIMIGSLLPILMALITKDSPMYAVGVACVFVIVQFLEGNFITPQIVGSKVSINPLASMIALILGGQVWGIAGLILAMPMVAVLKVIFDNIEGLKPFGYLLGETPKNSSR